MQQTHERWSNQARQLLGRRFSDRLMMLGRSMEPSVVLRVGVAHTVSVDSQTHLVYLPLTNLNGHPVLREMAPQ